MFKLNFIKENGLYFLGLIVLILALYTNTLSNGYTWDDQLVITQNEVTLKGVEGLKEIWTSRSYIRERPIYRPIPQTVHAILWEIAPDKPIYAHGINIFFYILCCLSFYMLIRLYFPKINPLLNLLIVSFFALHPIHTEVVSNNKSLDELLALFFALWALYLAKSASKLAKVGVVLLMILAALSKISVITLLPFIVLVWAKDTVLHSIELLKKLLTRLNLFSTLSLISIGLAALFYWVYDVELLALYLLFAATILAMTCTNRHHRSLLLLLLIPAFSYLSRWEFVLIAFVIHLILNFKEEEKISLQLIAETSYFLLVTSILDLNSVFLSILIIIILLSYWMKNKKSWVKKYFIIGIVVFSFLFVLESIGEHTFKMKIIYLLLVFGLLMYLPKLKIYLRLLPLLLFIPILEISSHRVDYHFEANTPLIIQEEVIPAEVVKSPINPYHNILVATNSKKEKYATIARIQLIYLKQGFLPLSLVHQYGTWQIQLASWKDWDVYLSILIHLILLGFVFYFYKKKYFLPMWGILWYFSSISIYTNVVRLMPDTLAERFLFAPSIGISLFCVSGLYFFVQKFLRAEKKSFITLSIILFPLFSYYAYKTIDRNKDWEDNYTLAANTLPYAQNNAAINAQYALELNNLIKYGQIDNVDSAKQIVVKHYQIAIEIYPDFYGPQADLASYYILQSQPEKAFPYLIEATRLMPSDWIHHYYLALIYYEKNNYKAAIEHFTSIINNKTLQARFSEFPELLEAYEFKARCLHNTGKDSEAYEVLNEAIDLYHEKSTYVLLANLYRVTGKTNLAIETFEQLLLIIPNDMEVINTINFLKEGKIY